jgi:hypothetical protein
VILIFMAAVIAHQRSISAAGISADGPGQSGARLSDGGRLVTGDTASRD